MTGDEIRETSFARVFNGYQQRNVNRWLADVAHCLDVGVPPASLMPPPSFAWALHGYDTTAVDQLVEALGFDGMPGPKPAEFGVSGLVPSEHPASQDRGSWLQQMRQYRKDCEAERVRVSTLPGTRLWASDRWTGYIKILDSDGQVLITHRRKTWTLANGQVLRQPGPGGEWVDATTGDPVLRTIGTHSYRKDDGAVLFPDRRWLRLPVQGYVMTAVSKSGTTLLWFRKVERGGTEVIVRPDCYITPDILCAIALTISWLDLYLAPPRGGG